MCSQDWAFVAPSNSVLGRPKAGPDDLEKNTFFFLPLPGTEGRLLDRPARCLLSNSAAMCIVKVKIYFSKRQSILREQTLRNGYTVI